MLTAMLRAYVTSPLLIYITRCILGFSVGYKLYMSLPEHELMWTMISIILVISPEGKDSRRLSIERFKSNMVGSAVALACILMHEPNFYVILVGIILTIITCYLFNIMNMARVALVTLLIVLVQPHTTQAELAPIFRFASVTIGCLIGLLITIFTSMILRYAKRKLQIVQ
ncbi:aromatic acid exporter family protein [Flavobacterium sp. NKUCC04_CG]|uniref:FUSC family protein n=1 Tax=Flavobacterium sp. NKUCC04_CG TaxID=2842121 RepID=UPI001C5B5B33|nr:FUSC family protein [Flavobacterium sp. NKUCC04_CG]MBW3518186.1 FUSC family protein [Flavobacterium sp. NKUCC04_CG]